MKARIILTAFSMIVVSACSATGTPAALQYIVWEVPGSPPSRRPPLTLVFQPDSYRGGFNCNNFEGENAFPSPGRIDLSRFSQTLKACVDDHLMEQDGYYDRMMRKITSYRLEPDGSLLLTAPDGDSIHLHEGVTY